LLHGNLFKPNHVSEWREFVAFALAAEEDGEGVEFSFLESVCLSSARLVADNNVDKQRASRAAMSV